MDKNMQRAEKKRNSWSKTSNNFAIKCLYSTGEWSRYFNKKTGVYALNELRRAIALLKELQGKIGIIRNFAEIISSSAFIVMNFSDQKRAIHQYWSRHDQSKEKLMRDIQNFQELINILDRFCEFVPPEIKSYLQLNFQVLKEAQKLFKIVEKYADYIDKLSQETQNSIANIWNTKNYLRKVLI
jgi:hypothetical protein